MIFGIRYLCVSSLHASLLFTSCGFCFSTPALLYLISIHSRIVIVDSKNGDTVERIDDASAADTILDIKETLWNSNRMFPAHRQRLVYRPGPRGMEPLADDETLGGAGVAQDGTAELDVLLAEVTEAEVAELDAKVQYILFAY